MTAAVEHAFMKINTTEISIVIVQDEHPFQGWVSGQFLPSSFPATTVFVAIGLKRLAYHLLTSKSSIFKKTDNSVNPSLVGWRRAIRTLLMSGCVVPRVSRYSYSCIT